MRQADEARQWSALQRRRRDRGPDEVDLGTTRFDLSAPCTVLGGRNGAGKSRLLRLLRDSIPDRAVLVDLHHLVEQALIVLRSRDDLDEMIEEFETIELDDERLDDVQRIVGREYGGVRWYALEIDPFDDAVRERFRWGGEQAVVPYFLVDYGNYTYDARSMGLGEFSAHFLFWILEQYKDRGGLILLLDEPDAYLPPVSASSFLARLLRLCSERDWSVILSTHSEELIRQAAEAQAFVLVSSDPDGALQAAHSQDDDRLVESLLASPSMELIGFCEDEAATYFTRALLNTNLRMVSRSSELIWGNGEAYLRALWNAIPRPRGSKVSFAYFFDGDQRERLPEARADRWPAIALPTLDDPDTLFKSLADRPVDLAQKLAASAEELTRVLGNLEGQDAHDWVNGLGAAFGRDRTLTALAELWCDVHPDDVAEFSRAVGDAGLVPGIGRR